MMLNFDRSKGAVCETPDCGRPAYIMIGQKFRCGRCVQKLQDKEEEVRDAYLTESGKET